MDAIASYTFGFKLSCLLWTRELGFTVLDKKESSKVSVTTCESRTSLAEFRGGLPPGVSVGAERSWLSLKSLQQWWYGIMIDCG